MPNRSVLLNTSVLTSNPFALARDRHKPGNSYAEVAESNFSIPIPWFFCFKPEDFHLVTVQYDDDEADGDYAEDEAPFVIALPCTSVAQALDNMARAFWHFEAIAGDKVIGKAYWQKAMDSLAALPLPFLAMNPLEFMWLGKPLEYAALIKEAFGGGPTAMAQIKHLSCYKDGVVPYPPEMLTREKWGDERLANAVALDGGFR
ncbi:hypothetical protein F2P45_22135 [Massilia sp. CCM 8733]|uniref:Uncharacterized protein n=1 Tax=Massilia mucilaginosa TaxID=2609282 RepID=A0ABX0NY83_9BURK|nr:hypothetical protein [Massilia mucilaginosa]NHZ91684.1 hypothetical protein [Massilia mucilaginosa]